MDLIEIDGISYCVYNTGFTIPEIDGYLEITVEQWDVRDRERYIPPKLSVATAAHVNH